MHLDIAGLYIGFIYHVYPYESRVGLGPFSGPGVPVVVEVDGQWNEL
jgi:hypothetical protein